MPGNLRIREFFAGAVVSCLLSVAVLSLGIVLSQPRSQGLMATPSQAATPNLTTTPTLTATASTTSQSRPQLVGMQPAVEDIMFDVHAFFTIIVGIVGVLAGLVVGMFLSSAKSDPTCAVTELRTKINALDERVEVLKTRVEDDLNRRAIWLESNTDIIKTRVTTLEANARTMEPRVTSLETKIANMHPRVATLETKTDSMQSRITALEHLADPLQAIVNALHTKAILLEPKIDEVISRINALEQKDNSLKPKN
jgi:chaperonin cofactor prefoldin